MKDAEDEEGDDRDIRPGIPDAADRKREVEEEGNSREEAKPESERGFQARIGGFTDCNDGVGKSDPEDKKEDKEWDTHIIK